MTDAKGAVYEHIEYLPFGETWVEEQHKDNSDTPYKFTGKELDTVTGLYYYGARYYDPRTSVWQSPDPILEQYMGGKPNGGVHNPKNLMMFSYTMNNPVNLTDPDGMASAETYVGGLNSKEISILANKVPANQLSNLSDNKQAALSMTKQEFGRNRKGDRSDAFRHAFFQAKNTQSIGADLTRELSSAHEYSTPENEVDTDLVMDIHNNDVGIEIGKNNPEANDEQLAKAVLDKMKSGDLVVLDKGQLKTSDGKEIKDTSQIRQFDESQKIGKEISGKN